MQQRPFQLHPDNWLPLILYHKIVKLSPLTTKTLGGSTILSKSLSVEAMRLILDIHAIGLSPAKIDYVVQAIGEIHSTYDRHEQTSLILSEQKKAKK